MPQFTRYEQNAEAPAVPEGWLFVHYDGAKIKIVDSLGNSMAPYSRALVNGSDWMVRSLIDAGTLIVVSEATVSLENYIETISYEPEPVDKKLEMLKKVMAAPEASEELVGEPPVQASEEAIAAKEEAVKKARKKKAVDTEAPEYRVQADDSSTDDSSETNGSDTATPDEEPSV